MIKHFCDLCKKELKENNKTGHEISFKHEGSKEAYKDFCYDCAEKIAIVVSKILYK